MPCHNPFNYLPILGTYRLTYYRATVLRAPPTLLRLCVLLEVAVALGVFALTYYYTATTSTTETVVTYEAKSSPYTCTVLSPRSDIQTYSSDSSELVAFSQARYDYSECTSALQDYDVCSNTYRKDYLLSVSGLGTESSNCYDVLLKDNYRFCYGGETETDLRAGTLSNQFSEEPIAPSETYADQYFFMNSSFNLHLQDNLDSTGSILSDFISDRDHTVYVLAESPNGVNAFLYQFDSTANLVKKAGSVNSVDIYGITYGNNKLYILTISQLPNPGGGTPSYQTTIYNYDITNGTLTTGNSFPCPGEGELLSADISSRYISYGSDNMLYIFCYESANPQTGFNYLRINPLTWQATSFSANITQLYTINEKNEVTTGKVGSVSQVLRVGGNMYFATTSPYNNLIKGSLQGVVGNKISNVTNLGYFNGDSILYASSSSIYFPGSQNHSYYDTVGNAFHSYYSLSSDASHYRATYLQLGFSYQICNGNYSDYAVQYSSDTSFSAKCGQVNGIHYQINDYFTIPSSCQSSMSSVSETSQLLTCSAVAEMQQTFADTYCTASFQKVCDSEFTNNPPFSCSREVYPTFLTIIATAIANSSGAWSLSVILIQLVLKMLYPHGTIDFDYDESVNRYLPLRNHDHNYWHHAKMKIHPTLSHRHVVEAQHGNHGNHAEGVELVKSHPVQSHDGYGPGNASYQPTNRAEYEQRLQDLEKGDIENGRDKYHRK